VALIFWPALPDPFRKFSIRTFNFKNIEIDDTILPKLASMSLYQTLRRAFPSLEKLSKGASLDFREIATRKFIRTFSAASHPDPIDNTNDSPLASGEVASSSSDFSLTEDQLEFQRVAEDFARERLAPHSAQWDAEHHFPVNVLQEAAALGFGGMYVSEDVGGSGLGRTDAAIIFEALSYGDVPVTAYLSIHNMVAGVLDKWGTPAQRDAYVPALSTMEKLASYCLTEPGSGSDAAGMKTTAKKKGGDYILDGAKAFISGGGTSDIYLVMARTGEPSSVSKGISAFVVEKGALGLSFGKKEEKMGWNAQPTTAVIFDSVRIPESQRIGQEGEGFKIAMQALDGGRINIAACSLGGAQFSLDTSREYVKHRKQFGKAVSEFQGIQFKIADMAVNVHASRLMIRHAAAAMDAKAPTATLQAAMAKRFATDACFDVANDALQLLGGYGYLKEYPIERILRDLRVHSILEVRKK